MMAGKTETSLTRRRFIQALTTVSAMALLVRSMPKPGDDIVEVDGWILRRSDLA